MNDQKLQIIIKYLDNQMSEEERVAFEKELRNDEVLAKEVAFQRGLHGFLERNQPSLEQQLSDLGDEFILDATQKKKAIPVWLFIGTIITLSLAAYFLFFNQSSQTPTETPSETEISTPKESIDDAENQSIEREENTEELNETEQEQPLELEKRRIPIDQPIANLDKESYKRNPVLESMIAEKYRASASENITFVTKPKADAIFKNAETIPLVVTGYTNIEPPYSLIIYSNRSFDIENDYRILDASLKTKPINGNNHFSFNGEVPLAKGLYYLVIKNNNNRDILHISRFTVK